MEGADMPIVTGSLSDIGLAPLTGLNPLLRFSPSSPALRADGRVFATSPVDVTPTSLGFFSVDLASTEGLKPSRTHWRVQVLFHQQTSDKIGYTETDYLPLELFVPAGGGSLGDLVGDSVPFDFVYVDVSVPNDAQRSAVLQFNPVTGDLFERVV